MNLELVLFYAFAALALFSAVAMVGFVRHVVAGAMSLVVTMISLAGIYVLLHAELVAAIQIMVYAGAILVLFLFVIMLLNLRDGGFPAAPAGQRILKLLGVGGSVGVGLLLFAGLWRVVAFPVAGPPAAGLRHVSRAGPRAVRRLRAGRRAGGADPAGRHRRRRHPREAEDRLSIPIEHVIGLSAALFGIGAVGALSRRNVIVILMSIELMLNAVNLALVGFNRVWAVGADGAARLDGQVFVLMVIAVAAAEVAIGLGILLSLIRNRDSLNVDDASLLRW